LILRSVSILGSSLLIHDLNGTSFNLLANFSLAGNAYATYWDTTRSLLVYATSSFPTSFAYVVSYGNVNNISQVTSIPLSGM
jgi:hypothetical protein